MARGAYGAGKQLHQRELIATDRFIDLPRGPARVRTDVGREDVSRFQAPTRNMLPCPSAPTASVQTGVMVSWPRPSRFRTMLRVEPETGGLQEIKGVNRRGTYLEYPSADAEC
jgi:hypothetical protein